MSNEELIAENSKLREEIKQLKELLKRKSGSNSRAYEEIRAMIIAKELSKDGTITTKEKIYKEAIKDIGTFEPMIVEEKAFENFKRIWEKQGLGFLIQEIAKKDKCIKVHCYYGSSTYDSKEMSLLIELLVEEAKQLNIEVKTKQEIESLLEMWH